MQGDLETMKHNDRGGGLQKPHEGKCARRKRKSAHQAGCPDSGTTYACHLVNKQLIASVNRLAYAVRKGKREGRRSGKVLRLLNRLIPEPLHGKVKAKRDKRCFGDRISFVPATGTDFPSEVLYARRPGLSGSGLHRIKHYPWMGYDPRVFGTVLEAESVLLARTRRDRHNGRKVKMMDLVFDSDDIEVLSADEKFMYIWKSNSFPDLAAYRYKHPVFPGVRTPVSSAVISTALSTALRAARQHRGRVQRDTEACVGHYRSSSFVRRYGTAQGPEFHSLTLG